MLVTRCFSDSISKKGILGVLFAPIQTFLQNINNIWKLFKGKIP